MAGDGHHCCYRHSWLCCDAQNVNAQIGAKRMDELIVIFRRMRTDADQAIQLLTSGQLQAHSDTAAALERIRTWRNELDNLIEKYGDPRDERA